jgi:hypothetical protein
MRRVVSLVLVWCLAGLTPSTAAAVDRSAGITLILTRGTERAPHGPLLVRRRGPSLRP